MWEWASTRLGWSAVAAAMLSALALLACAAVAEGPPSTAQAVVNPHWDAAQCGVCHKMSGDKPQPIAARDVDTLCLSCHDGQRASAESHPIARPVDEKQYKIPQGWPLEEGRLGCVSCHDVQLHCSTTAQRQSFNMSFLRGRVELDLSSRKGQDFCVNCHAPQQFEKFDPHLMLDAMGGVVEERCLFCHTKVLDRSPMQRSGDAALRMDQAALCGSCHQTHKDIFNGPHRGLKANDTMLAYMRAREVVGLMGQPSDALIKQIAAAHARPTKLYLGPDGAVACASCHNPHEDGLFKPGSDLAYRSMHIVAGRPVSPVHNAEFCRYCHHF